MKEWLARFAKPDQSSSRSAAGGLDPPGPGFPLIVVDASVIVWLLAERESSKVHRTSRLRTITGPRPAHLDLEVLSALRRYVALKRMTLQRAEAWLCADFVSLRIERYELLSMLDRIWELKENLTPYDAAYVALAETLRSQLLTRDVRLAAAPGHRARDRPCARVIRYALLPDRIAPKNAAHEGPMMPAKPFDIGDFDDDTAAPAMAPGGIAARAMARGRARLPREPEPRAARRGRAGSRARCSCWRAPAPARRAC